VTEFEKNLGKLDARIGNRVRLRRALLGMSQEKLARLVGLTCQQIKKYERGINRISAGRLWDIARILRAPVTFFFDDLHPTAHDGSSRPKSHDNILPSKQGMQLNAAFMRIRNDKLRRDLLNIVQTLASIEVAE